MHQTSAVELLGCGAVHASSCSFGMETAQPPIVSAPPSAAAIQVAAYAYASASVSVSASASEGGVACANGTGTGDNDGFPSECALG